MLAFSHPASSLLHMLSQSRAGEGLQRAGRASFSSSFEVQQKVQAEQSIREIKEQRKCKPRVMLRPSLV